MSRSTVQYMYTKCATMYGQPRDKCVFFILLLDISQKYILKMCEIAVQNTYIKFRFQIINSNGGGRGSGT